MGVDTTFQPKTATFAVDSSAAVTIDGRQVGVTSWRIRFVQVTPSIDAGAYIKWAQGGASAPTAPAGPTLGAPAVNVLGVTNGQVLYIEGIGAFLQFIGSTAIVASNFEVTGGQGGCGG